jgi:hypothetical protein
MRRTVSVWDAAQGQYRYYAVPSPGGVAVEPRPPVAPPPSRPPLGDPPDRLLARIPPGALYVGSGPLARGEIVTWPRGA